MESDLLRTGLADQLRKFGQNPEPSLNETVNMQYANQYKISVENIGEYAPDFAKDLLLDLVPAKVKWVQDVDDRGATRSGY